MLSPACRSVLLLLPLMASLLMLLSEPAASAFSRWEEHAADAYGLAITRAVTPDAGEVAAQAFALPWRVRVGAGWPDGRGCIQHHGLLVFRSPIGEFTAMLYRAAPTFSGGVAAEVINGRAGPRIW